MVTLLGSIIGFLGALVPELLKMFQDGKDKAHEIFLLQMQLDREEKGIQGKIEEVRIQSEAIETKALYSTYKTGIHWVDAYNGSVRPTIAYAFFALYASMKLLLLQMAEIGGLWTAEDQAIFAGIISFYFGQRALRR